MAVDEPLDDVKGFVCLLQVLVIGEYYLVYKLQKHMDF